MSLHVSLLQNITASEKGKDKGSTVAGADTGFLGGARNPPPHGCLQFFFYILTHIC